MNVYHNNVQNTNGNALAGATVTVRVAASPPGSGALATIYSDDGVTLVVGSALTTDSAGRFKFWAPDGKYDLTVSGTGVATPYTIEDVEVADVSERHASDVVHTANIFDAGTGFRVAGAATNRYTLIGNGTNFVPGQLDASDITGTIIPYAGTVDCSAQVGADEGTKLLACYNALPSTGGTMDARGIAGGTIATDVFSALTGKQATLLWGAGIHAFTLDTTIPANIAHGMSQGSILAPASGKTLTIRGDVNAPASQVFGGSGSISFSGNEKISFVLPQWWGAVGDGVIDDQAAIQDAIDAAETVGVSTRSGAMVYFPSGIYRVLTSLILPRNGAQPLTEVGLIGEDVATTQIALGVEPTFPINRAVIEWEAVLARVQHPRIENLTINVPRVTGAMAIHYEPTLKTSAAEFLAERMLNPRFTNLLILGSNEFHEKMIYLEGEIILADFQNIACDPSIVSYVFDTVCIASSTDLFGSTVATGTVSGFAYSNFKNIGGSIRSGGYVQVFEGSFSRSTWRDSFCNGSRNASCFEFINSFGSTLDNLSTEGQGEKGMFKFNNVSQFYVTNFGLGAPNSAGSGVGNGMELVSTIDSVFYNRATGAGVPSFTASAVKLITVDANSHRNRFFNLLANDTFANEITDSGNNNYFEGWNIAGATRQSLGTLWHGDIESIQNLSWLSGTAFSGILDHTNTASRTYTFPDATGNVPSLPSTATTETGSGAIVRATSPTLVTPTLGVATGTSFQGIIGNVTPAAGTFTTLTATGAATAETYSTETNCSSSASPAVCADAAAGSFVIAAAATTVTVNTTKVTANSQIILTEDSSLGTKLGVTCNTTIGRNITVTARTAATSFAATVDVAPVTNPMCISYAIVN